MKVLSKHQILLLHEQLIDETGGSPSLRDEGLLDSALNAPFQGFGSTSAYPSLQQKVPQHKDNNKTDFAHQRERVCGN